MTVHTTKPAGCAAQVRRALTDGGWLTLREIQEALSHQWAAAEIQSALAKMTREVESTLVDNPLKLGRRVVKSYRMRPAAQAAESVACSQVAAYRLVAGATPRCAWSSPAGSRP